MKEARNKLIVSYEYSEGDNTRCKLNDIFDWLFSKMSDYLTTVSGVVTVSGTKSCFYNNEEYF